MLICIHCSMKAMLEDKPLPSFEESPEEHTRLYHPDPVATQKEREDLERRLSERVPPL